MIPREIELKESTFQNQYYVTGHFDFKIEVEYEDNSKKEIIDRRYSEIRALYKKLIIKCPGCYIPHIPEKSIWLKINYGNENQMKERKEGIKEFLTHLVKHDILRKNKDVINFFSKSFKRLNTNESKTTDHNKNNNREDSDDDDDDDDDLYSFDKSYSKKEKKKEDEDNGDDDIEPLEDFVNEYNNKNKGIFSKGKKLIGNMYNYMMSYKSNTNKEDENDENNNNNNNDENNNYFYKKLRKEDYEFIKKKTKEMGEDFQINNYNERINRLNDGVKNIIQNFENLISVNNKKINILKNIIKNDDIYKNLNKEKNDEKNEDDDDDNDKDNEKSGNNLSTNHTTNINRLKKYCKSNTTFLEKINQNLVKIRKYQILLEGLLDIYERKKDHLNFLGRLHFQKDELEKQNNMSDPLTKNKIEKLEEQLNHEIKFIKKINKDLKYEIEKYKQSQDDIYIFINSLFKDKANNIKINIENLNKENFEDINEDEEQNIENSTEKNKPKEYIDKKEDDF